MRDTVPPAAVEGRAMIARPSSASAAPRMKSIWPPTPRVEARADRVGAHLAGQVDLIAELMATIRRKRRMTAVSLV